METSLKEIEAEELALALAISLSEYENGKCEEDDRYGNEDQGIEGPSVRNRGLLVDDVVRRQQQCKDDESLAKKLQEELNRMPNALESGGRSDKRSRRGGNERNVRREDICAGCGEPMRRNVEKNLKGMFAAAVSFTEPTRYVKALGRTYHPQCLKCYECNGTITGDFTVAKDGTSAQSARYRELNGPLLFHPECYRIGFHPRCSVCENMLPEEPGGRIVYKIIPFWGDKLCRYHTEDGTLRCACCTRLKPVSSDEWALLDDGRWLCLMCLGSVVPDSSSAQPIYEDVLHFFSSHNMVLPTEPPPLYLVEYSALNEAAIASGVSKRNQPQTTTGSTPSQPSDGPIFHTRGICITEYRQIVRKNRLVSPLNVLGFPFGKKLDQVEGVEVCGPIQVEVTAILVLKGLPRLLTGCIIAHETMHAWIRTNGYQTLMPKIEEGLCQLMALLWLEAQGNKPEGIRGMLSKPEGYEERLASFLGYQIRNDRSEIYGNGFREALESFQRVGNLHLVLDHVRNTGALP